MTKYFNPDVKICILKRFYNEASAKLYQSRLQSAGIESFISNSITSTLLPFSEGGFILHVRENDLTKAKNVLQHVDEDLDQISTGDFKEADLEDIYYEKEVWTYDQKLKNSSPRLAFIILILAFLLFVLLDILKKGFW